MNAIEEAILRTILYADIFNFPLTAEEIHHFLIADQAISEAAVTTALRQSTHLNSLLTCIDGYFMRADRPELAAARQQRQAASQQLWPCAVRYGVWLARLPFVRMVAVTGALAVQNAAGTADDLDYVLVTAPGRVWLARGFAVLLVRLIKLRGTVICPNYVVSESALEQDQQDVFIAHEVAQMVPIFGHALYQRVRACNHWVIAYLPNATGSFHTQTEQHLGHGWLLLKRGLERLLGGFMGDALEAWEHRRKLRKLAPQLQTPHHAARLDETQVKGHFNDYGHLALRRYQERLREYNLNAQTLPAAGD